MYNEKFSAHLKKYNNYLEKKAVESNNIRRFYTFINSKIREKSSVSSLVEGGIIATSAMEKADVLANQFEKIFQKDDGRTPEHFDPHPLESMKDIPWFGANQLYELINKWSNSSSMTPDLVPLYFIKRVAAVICGPLSYIFNQSLMYSEIPQRWKHCFVTPILKKEPASNPENYRPVSITSVFCRLFEKVLKEHMLIHIHANGIFPPNQHGFSSGRSVQTNLLECLDDWTEAADRKHRCDVVYFDFAKAFDRVSHQKLVVKLEKYKFHPIVIKWIAQYLTGRTFQVKVENSFSSVRWVESGVPQGAVLSPILFNIYTAELPNIVQQCDVTMKMYADDVKIYRTITRHEDVCLMQNAIDLLASWADRWQLPLSPQKTVVLHLNSGTSTHPYTYNINGCTLAAVDSVKDLGFHYDNNLDFGKHIREVCNSAMLRTANIFRALTTKNKSILLKVYKTYVRPLVESSASVFAPYKKKDICRMEKVQNNFTRKLLLRTNSFLYSRVPKASIRNKYLGIPTLESRRKVFDVCLVHKLLNFTPASGPCKFFKTKKSLTRGEPKKLSLPRPRTRLRATSFTYRAGSLYLKIAKHIQSPVTPGQMKSRVGIALLRNEIS